MIPPSRRDARWWALRVILPLVGVAGLAGLVATQVGTIGDCRVDDAYITLSFSKNLAEGNGPVYSQGMRVEGYSNFLWMLLLAPAYLLHPGIDGYAVARGLGFVSLAVLGVFSYRLARCHAPAVLAGAVLLLLAFTTDFTWAALSGLETVGYVALLTTALAVYVREDPRTRWPLAIPAFVAVALIRIDGFIPLGFVVAYELVRSIRERRFTWRWLLRWAGPGLAVYAAYFAWRWGYYGLLFPTTYYSKSDIVLIDHARGFEYVWRAARGNGFLFALPLITLAVVRPAARDARLLATYFVLHVAYVIKVGGDWMHFDRFLLPILPIAMVLTVWGAAHGWQLLRRADWIGRVAGLAAMGACLVVIALHLDRRYLMTPIEKDKIDLAEHIKRHTRDNLIAAAPYVRALARPGESLATDYAGVFAVESKALIIDMWGLCHKGIALRGGWTPEINPIYGRSCPSCYAELGPDYFHATAPMLRNRDAYGTHAQVVSNVFTWRSIARYLNLQRDYVTARVTHEPSGHAMFFLERKRPGESLGPRPQVQGMRVDYPFGGP